MPQVKLCACEEACKDWGCTSQRSPSGRLAYRAQVRSALPSMLQRSRDPPQTGATKPMQAQQLAGKR